MIFKLNGKWSMRRKIKNALYKNPDLIIAKCEFGHGVFARQNIAADSILEECPHLRVHKDDCKGIIDDYVFYLMQEKNGEEVESDYYSLPLGFGSIYNHSDNHNADYWHDRERELIVFYAIRDINKGEQIFVNYGESWWESRDLTPSNES